MRLLVRELLMSSHPLVCAFTSALFSTSTSIHSKCPLAAARDSIGRPSPSRAVTSAPCVASKQRGHSHSSATCHHLCHVPPIVRFHKEVILCMANRVTVGGVGRMGGTQMMFQTFWIRSSATSLLPRPLAESSAASSWVLP